ncbi:hypothetical protein [Streptomyces sp. NBC_00582]|uniref:hypothetical protein n=1 Tax=Streptomyces sp. NBC_00582 TaxID=2975783 RepID=UPI002E817C05|nr:hypothetical protein [Streptomyces sp. NBC_00582]WUB61509.1 hypothetical protein OG852_14470 [Streptomyces sp. NBC_00582]
MAERWPPADLFGLHVDLGDYHSVRRVWLRLPVARFTCLNGCDEEAVGAADVAALTERLAQTHARSCPGPAPKESSA